MVTLQSVDIDDYAEMLLDYAMLDKYNKTERELLAVGIPFVDMLFICKTKGFIGGMLFFCTLHDGVKTLDAYKDDKSLKAINSRGDFSYRVGRIAMNWFMREYEEDLFTSHRVENRGATWLCKRLGFEHIGYGMNNEFITFKKENKQWD